MLNDRIVDVPCASTVAEDEHEDPEVMLFETYVAIPDVVDIGLPSDRVIPCAVPWPASWIILVQMVRSLQRPVMCGDFSGMAVLSTAFAALAIRLTQRKFHGGDHWHLGIPRCGPRPSGTTMFKLLNRSQWQSGDETENVG